MSQDILDDQKKLDIDHVSIAKDTPLERDIEGLEYGDYGQKQLDGSYLLGAEEAGYEQKTQSLWSALAQYKPAILWSVVISASKFLTALIV